MSLTFFFTRPISQGEYRCPKCKDVGMLHPTTQHLWTCVVCGMSWDTWSIRPKKWKKYRNRKRAYWKPNITYEGEDP